MADRHPSGRVYFTVNDLRSALNRLVMADPEVGNRPILMESDLGFTDWNGTFYRGRSDPRGYVVLEDSRDRTEFDPAAAEWVRLPEAERPRCPQCGLPHDLEGWPAEVCRRMQENGRVDRPVSEGSKGAR